MPCRRHSSASAPITSRPYGVRSAMSQSETFESNIAKPSWCLAVIVMYRMPAAFTSETHSFASKSTGLKKSATFS